MTLLSSILGISQTRSGFSPILYPRDDRDAVRHDSNLPVSIHLRGVPVVTGSVINISVGGAAIQIHGWNNVVPSNWFSRLDQGTEVGLTGLLDTPVTCWVVMFDKFVLRVHFASDGALRRQLRAVIGLLPAA